LGNLSENESLKTFSGGMWYRKTINLEREQSESENVILDLGRVVASAEVKINGKTAGIKSISPWEFNVTGKLKEGENQIEILVYNTLGNHFLTTPSQYIGRTDSGLMGPVKLIFKKKGQN
jgi:beta-galactosidase/beta-glucuronidase